MIGANALHVRFSVGTLSISIRELTKTVKVADLLAEIELKSAVPAQLLELLNPGAYVNFMFYSVTFMLYSVKFRLLT